MCLKNVFKHVVLMFAQVNTICIFQDVTLGQPCQESSTEEFSAGNGQVPDGNS